MTVHLLSSSIPSEATLTSGHRADRLTRREREVWLLVASGLNNAEIADRLFVSVPTVKTHVAQLLRKTATRDRVQLAVLAWSRGVMAGSADAALPRPRKALDQH